MTCEMTFDGPQCGNSARHAVGFTDPVTDDYRRIQLICASCAGRLMDETSEQFRMIPLNLARRLRTV